MHRRYDRSHARFLQPDPYGGSYDPADPQSLNRYSYTQNDPVNFTDPSGLTLCSAQYSFSDCGGWEGVAGGYFGDAYATHQRHYGGLSAEVVGDMQAHEERVNNAYGGNGYRTNAEVNRAVADFYIYYRFNPDGSLWTDFNIFADVSGGGSRAWELAREMNRRPVGKTFGVLYGSSVLAGGGAGLALSAAGGGGLATLGLSTVQPGEFAVIGQLPATGNFVGMTNVNVLSITNWTTATQAAWIQRMTAMRMPFFVAGGPKTNPAGLPTQFGLEVRRILAARYREVGPWLLPR